MFCNDKDLTGTLGDVEVKIVEKTAYDTSFRCFPDGLGVQYIVEMQLKYAMSDQRTTFPLTLE